MKVESVTSPASFFYKKKLIKNDIASLKRMVTACLGVSWETLVSLRLEVAAGLLLLVSFYSSSLPSLSVLATLFNLLSLCYVEHSC